MNNLFNAAVGLPVGKMLAMMFLPGLVKSILFYFAFRIIDYKVSILTCLLIVFAPLGLFGFLPFVHLPLILGLIVGILIKVYILNYYTDIDLYPAIIIVSIVDLVFFALKELFL